MAIFDVLTPKYWKSFEPSTDLMAKPSLSGPAPGQMWGVQSHKTMCLDLWPQLPGSNLMWWPRLRRPWVWFNRKPRASFCKLLMMGFKDTRHRHWSIWNMLSVSIWKCSNLGQYVYTCISTAVKVRLYINSQTSSFRMTGKRQRIVMETNLKSC